MRRFLSCLEVLRQLSDAFGTQFLVQPTKPMFFVDPRGSAHPLPSGEKSADALRGFVQRYR